MANEFKPYATIGGKRYWFFRPKDMPERIFAYDIDKKTAHYVGSSVQSVLKLEPEKIRVVETMKTPEFTQGEIWSKSWYERFLREKGPFTYKWEKEIPPSLEKATPIIPKPPKLSRGHYLYREEGTPEVYAVNPRTGEAHWLAMTAKEFEEGGWSWGAIQDIKPGQLARFKIKEKWEAPKAPPKAPPIEKVKPPVDFKLPEVEEAFTLSEFSTKLAETTPAVRLKIPKPVLPSPIEKVTKDVEDIVSKSEEEKKKLDSEYRFNSDYYVARFDQARKKQMKVVSEDMPKAGYKFDKATGELELSTTMQEAADAIKASKEKLEGFEKEYLDKTDAYVDIIKTFEGLQEKLDDLEKEIARQETTIKFEERAERPNAEKINTAVKELKRLENERDSIIDEVQKKYPSLEAMHNDISSLETKIYETQALFKKETMPKEWANLFALGNVQESAFEKLSLWGNEEKKAILGLYETGVIHFREAAEMIGLSQEEFQKLITPTIAGHRKIALEKIRSEEEIRGMLETANREIAKSLLGDWGKKVWKPAKKLLEVSFGELSAIMASAWEVAEMRKLNKEVDSLMEYFSGKFKPWKEMNDDEKRKYQEEILKVQTVTAELEKVPDSVGDWAKLLGKAVWKPDPKWASLAPLVEELVGPPPKGEETAYRWTVNALGFVLMWERGSTFVESAAAKAFTTFNRAARFILPKNIKAESFTKFIADSFYNTGGVAYKKIMPKRLPLTNAFLQNLIARSVGKNVPATIKKFLEYRKETTQTRTQKMTGEGLGKLGEVASDKKRMNELIRIYKSKELPLDEKQFLVLAKLDPDFYRIMSEISHVEPTGVLLGIVQKGISKSKALKIESKAFEWINEIKKRIPESWQGEQVLQLLQKEAVKGGVARYHKVLVENYGKKTADFLLDTAKEVREYYKWIHKIPLPPGTKVKIPWALLKGEPFGKTRVHLISEKSWKALHLADDAKTANWSVKGSSALAKTLKDPTLKEPILHQIIVLRRSMIRSTDDFIADLIHETSHLWIKEVTRADDLAAAEARSIFSSLTGLLNQQKKVNLTVAGIYNLLKKVYPFKTEAEFTEEFYALALEIYSMVRLNKATWVKIAKIFRRNIKKGKLGLFYDIQDKMITLAERGVLLSNDQLKFLIPTKLSKTFEKRLLSKYTPETVAAYKRSIEGGVDFVDRDFPAIIAYKKGFVPVRFPEELKKLIQAEKKLLSGTTKGWEFPRFEKTPAYDLISGMYRELQRKVNHLKAREIKKLMDETRWKDLEIKAISEKYLDRFIRTGRFPRQSPVVLGLLNKGKDFATALSQGRIVEMQKIAFRNLTKELEKLAKLDAWTPEEKKAIDYLTRQLVGSTTVIHKGIADLRKAYGLYGNVIGEDTLKLWDFCLTGSKRINMPLFFKRFMSGAWKESNPGAATAMRTVFSVIHLPLDFWKWMVLFGRPGWGVRNTLDDTFRVGLNAENADLMTWKWMAMANTPAGRKAIRHEIASKTPMGKLLGMSGMFTADNPFRYSDPLRSLNLSIVSRSGIFRKLEKYAFKPVLKAKQKWELIFTEHETLRREALFLDYVFKVADKAAKAHLERIFKMQKSQKSIIDELKFLIPDEKLYDRVLKYGQRIVEGTITQPEINALLRLAKKYKLKDTRILENGFKEVDRIMFDYSDLMKIERGLRWVFPFYGFWSKNFVLWSKSLAKDPRLRRAAIVYIKAIQDASEDLPEWYKDRIKIFGSWYTLPVFSIFQVLDVYKDPVGEILKWKDNKNHPISGLAWNPAISTFIKKKTGKGYWDDRKDFKDYGWTDEMINRLGKKNVDLEANTSIFEIYARQIPLFNLVYMLSEKNSELLKETDSALKSKNLNAWTSYLLGFSLKNIDDLQKLWGAYWRMLPQDRNKFMATLSQEDYDRLYKLLNLKNAEKLIKAEQLGINDPAYVQYMEDFPYRFEYYRLLDRVGTDEAKYYLAVNKDARAALQRHWDFLEYSPERAAKEHLFYVGEVRNVAYQILEKLPKKLEPGMEYYPALYEFVTGQVYHTDYTQKDFEDDIFDKHGSDDPKKWTLIPETLEELNALIPFKGKDWLEKIVKTEMELMSQFPEQWYRQVIEADKRSFNYEYSVLMRTFGKMFIPWDIPASIDVRGAAQNKAYEEIWDKMPDNFKAEYLIRHPYKAIWHDVKSAYLKKIAVLIDPKNLDNWFNNFYNDKYFNDRDREYYFIKHPLKRIYYPTARNSQAEWKKDEENRKKGIFTNFYHDFLDNVPKNIQQAWEKDSPTIWENHRWKKGYNILIGAGRYEEAVDFYWSSKYETARERYFARYPEERIFREKQKVYWKLPRQTWEEEHEALGWLLKNPDYIEWTHRFEVTEEQKAHGKIRDELYEVKYKIKLEGKGLDFLMEMAEWEAKKRQIYEENPWLEKEYIQGLTPEMRKKYEMTKAFFDIDIYDYEAKQEYLKAYPELKKSWRDMAQPWERRILDLQDKYFMLKTAGEKETFLAAHSELVNYWTSKSYPWSFWYDKAKFKNNLELIDTAINTIEARSSLSDNLKSILERPKNEDERFIANKIYQWSTKQWIDLGQEDSQKGWDFFENLPKQVKDIYFKKHPGQREYFAFTNEWHRKLQISSEEGNKFFNSSLNQKWRELYFERHPENKIFFKQLDELSKFSRETWEDEQKVRAWWARHDELKNWLAERETEIEKEMRLKRESYFAILDRIPLVGSGKSYWERYFQVRLEAEEFLKLNEDLREWLRAHRRGDEQILKIEEAYFALDSPEKRFNYLQDNPQLKEFWLKRSAPKKREILNLQEQYFIIPKSEYEKRNKFLIDNPELLAYWNAQNLPYEYYFEPKKFKAIQDNLNLFKDYFNALIEDTAKGERVFASLSEDLRIKYINGTLNNYEKNQLYLTAMNTWINVIKQNFLRGNYYFKSLPSWIRKRYFLAHPEKQFVFSVPLEDFIMEPLIKWEKENPELAWAYRTMYEFEKLEHLPSALRAKVEEIFIKAGVWEDRKKWTKTDWKRYWEKLSLLQHELREKDIERLPRLKQAIERVGKAYPIKPRPKPIFRRAPRRGWIRPYV